MPALAREIVVAVFAFGKIDADFDELANARGSGFDDGARNGFVAKSVAGNKRIAHVIFKIVRLVKHAGDPALRVIGV